jgi:ribonucleoside-diphosphate reductase alpha chain
LGIGVMGFHSYLQTKSIPFASAMAVSVNMRMGKHIKKGCDAATEKLAREKGPCPDAAKHGVMRRNSNVTAIAPTASVSIICGTVSPSMELWSANAFTQKTLSGSFQVRNRPLEELLEEKGMNTPEVWSYIITHEGSVQGLDGLTDHEKDVYKTAFEEDQRWVIEHASIRQESVDQMISTNLFLRANVHKVVLLGLHVLAWKKKLKSLYYLRSKSMRRADKVSHSVEREKFDKVEAVEEEVSFSSFDADGCLACQ